MITVHLAPEDPRYVDLRRNILSKLERVLPDVAIRLAGSGQSMVGSTSDEAYGEIEYSYGGRSAKTDQPATAKLCRCFTSWRESPFRRLSSAKTIWATPWSPAGEHALLWFFGGLPLLIVLAWWWTRRAPRIPPQFITDGGQS